MYNIYQFFGGNHFSITWAEIRALQFFKHVDLKECKEHISLCHSFDNTYADYAVSNTILVYTKLTKLQVIKIFNQMGGSFKVAKFLDFEVDSLVLIRKILEKFIQKYIQSNNKKMYIRFNFYNFNKKDLKKTIEFLGIQKKEFKEKGILLKFVGNIKRQFVNTASSRKFLQKQIPEINITFDYSKNVYLASETIAVQNINLFETLEFKRPERDMKIGMMPIKLAFIMLNLANLKSRGSFWDPMCGVGTLIMAGILKKLYSFGSDVNFIALAKAKQNIDWLLKLGLANFVRFRVFKFDIFKNPRNNKILKDIIRFGRFDAIVTEGYLGKPRLKPFFSKQKLNTQLREIEKLYSVFLKTVSSLIFPSRRVVFTVPLFKVVINNKVSWIMPNISINKNRYRIIKYNTGDLVWKNPRSNVARKIFILEKIK